MQRFVDLLEELGIECQIGDATKIRAAEPPKQKHDRRDAELQPHVTRVLVCDPRKNALLNAGNKNDRIDAQSLADLGSVRPRLLFPIEHISAQAQQDRHIDKRPFLLR